MIVFGLLFFIQEITIGQLPFLKNVVVFNFVHLKDLIIVAISLLFILKFVDFYIPQRRSDFKKK